MSRPWKRTLSFGVIKAQLMQQRGVQIMHMHGILRDVEAKIVALTVGEAWFHATTGEPHAEAVRR